VTKHGGNPDERESDRESVELANYTTRFEADVILAKLQANGIEATVEHSELGGGAYGTGLTVDSTHRIFVFKRDLKDARLLIREQ
jgi:hypothetical protein